MTDAERKLLVATAEATVSLLGTFEHLPGTRRMIGELFSALNKLREEEHAREVERRLRANK
jgi:hypothetical protein